MSQVNTSKNQEFVEESEVSVDASVEDIEKEAAMEEVFAAEEVTKTLDATQIYLSEIGFSPLLSAEEEVFFCKKGIERL